MTNSRVPLACLVATLVFGFSAASLGQRTRVQADAPASADLKRIHGALDDIEERMGVLVTQTRGLQPFKVEIPGGTANSAAAGSANPELFIESDGNGGTFVVTSILVKSNLPSTGFVALSANFVEVNGSRYDTRTQSFFSPTGSSVFESADLMGTPIRTTGFTSPDPLTGGNFPHQIVADAAGGDDIRIQLFARSDTSDLDISSIMICGYRLPNHNISATYVPGN